MSTLVIVNPSATTVQARVLGIVVEAFASLGAEVRVRTTEARGHATEVAAAARADGTDLIVVVGGDGTANEVANGLLSVGTAAPRPTLAIVPAGHTNVFARVLGFPSDPVEATALLLDGIRERRYRSVSVGRADDRHFLFSAGLGLDAEVLTRVEQQRAKGVKASIPLYVASAVLAHASTGMHGNPSIRIDYADGRPPMTDVYSLIVQNAPVWTYFGALPVTFAPGAELAGGLAVHGVRSLDPLTLSNHLALAALMPSRLESSEQDLDAFTVRTDEPLLLQVDGDVVGERSEVRFETVRDALRVVSV